MFLDLSKEEIIGLEKEGRAEFISIFDTIENAKGYYDDKEEEYVGYIEEEDKLDGACSTPVKVYKLLL